LIQIVSNLGFVVAAVGLIVLAAAMTNRIDLLAAVGLPISQGTAAWAGLAGFALGGLAFCLTLDAREADNHDIIYYVKHLEDADEETENERS
jgi:hypothetical protein